jgi:two-component system KDP operon response regulator KdpE
MNEHPRIMIIENDQEMLKFLDSMLEREGFDTVVMTEADDAPDLLQNMAPDLVILEISPFEEDGLEILDLMRKQSDAPIVVLSTDIDSHSLQRAISHGADDFVRMPFGIKPFLARLRAKLRRRQEQMILQN